MDGIAPAANPATVAGAGSPASSITSAPAAMPAANTATAAGSMVPGTGVQPAAVPEGTAPAPGQAVNPAAAAQPAPDGVTSPEGDGVSQTQAFSHRFSEWQDRFIRDQGFQDIHGQPITNYRQYQSAMEEAQQMQQNQQIQQQTGADPGEFRKAVEMVAMQLPVVQAADEMMRRTNRETQLGELETALKTMAPNVHIDQKRPDLGLPNADKIAQYIRSGLPLVDAFKAANLDTLITTAASAGQQNAVNQITGAAASSPGPLGAGAPPTTYLTPDQVRAMSQADVKKNMALIDESMKHWKN